MVVPVKRIFPVLKSISIAFALLQLLAIILPSGLHLTQSMPSKVF